MCGRFSSLLSPELLEAIFGVTSPVLPAPRYNIAPTQPVLIVRQEISGRRETALVNWGLIPSWSKDPSPGKSIINARCETVADKPSFRAAFRHHRCIIPASGFYEWQKIGESRKQPWYITSVDGSPLSFAGLWDHWQSPDGSEIETCAILTTGANYLMLPIHDRMPVILSKDGCDLWLDTRECNAEKLKRLYEPFPAQMMQSWPVSSFVNSPNHDGEGCIQKVG